MLEIKFRGKHKISGGWYYGYLYKQDDDWIITTDGYTRYVVDEKTIGQDTCLKDKNGKNMYEKDIVTDNSGKVYIQGLCNAERIIKQPTVGTTEFEWEEVIGNIYESPELLNP